MPFLIILLVALAVSSIGFKKYIWFISIGYGSSIAAIGLAMLILFHGRIDPELVAACVVLIIYGCRLAGYLAYRELKSTSYNKKMVGEIKDGKDISFGARCAIWVSCALLYACEASPLLFRLEKGGKTDGFVIAGLVLAITGVTLESMADLQKNLAKKKNPGRFVDHGLYRIVRCPNYLGELILWTGIFLMGFGAGLGILQWILCLLGYIGIVYVMFSGARRLEIRQNRTYGDDEEYRQYVKTVPILIPLIPLYSVEKYTWLVA